jgi:signal peptidase I
MLVVAIAINGAILYGISRLFKITQATYLKSVLINAVTGISASIISAVLGLIGLGIFGNLIATIIGLVIFYLFFKKLYKVTIGKTLGVYFSQIVIGIIIALIIVIPIRRYVASPFVVQGNSMSPRLNQGDYLIIDKYNKDYGRFDIIVFKIPGKDTYYIKRIIGLPTEKIVIKDGKILVNDKIFDDSFITRPIMGDSTITLGADEYFVLGDNQGQSFDSRNFGPVKASDIVGKQQAK